MNALPSTPASAAVLGTLAVQEAAMYRRILLIVLLGLLTSACVPYYQSGGYYRSDYYTSDRYVYPGYYRQDRYYVAPQPRYYYQPAPRYHRPYPAPGLQPRWHGNPRYDYGNRQRYDYGGDRNRNDYRHERRDGRGDRWHSNRQGNPRGNHNWQR